MGVFSSKTDDGTKVLNRAREAYERGDQHFVARVNATFAGFATAFADTLNQTTAAGWTYHDSVITTEGVGQTAYSIFTR